MQQRDKGQFRDVWISWKVVMWKGKEEGAGNLWSSVRRWDLQEGSHVEGKGGRGRKFMEFREEGGKRRKSGRSGLRLRAFSIGNVCVEKCPLQLLMMVVC